MEEEFTTSSLKVKPSQTIEELTSNSIYLNPEIYSQLKEASSSSDLVYGQVRKKPPVQKTSHISNQVMDQIAEEVNNQVYVFKPASDIFRDQAKMPRFFRDDFKISDVDMEKNIEITIQAYKLNGKERKLVAVEFSISSPQMLKDSPQVVCRTDLMKKHISKNVTGHFLKKGSRLVYKPAVRIS